MRKHTEGLQTKFTFAWICIVAARHKGSPYFLLHGINILIFEKEDRMRN